MSHRIAGPICVNKVGSRWIDAGTLCRSRSAPPGPLRTEAPRLPWPLRMLSSMILAATPEESDGKVDPQTIIKIYIDEIQKTPFGGSDEGKPVVRMLKHLSKYKKISFKDMDDRGGFSLGEITVNQDFYDNNNMWKTMCTLVHEGSHAVWDANHPPKRGTPEKHESLVQDELIAETNELKMYEWSKRTFHGVTDDELEQRLQKLRDNKLKASIEQWMDAGSASY
jgi:hypothetical protein